MQLERWGIEPLYTAPSFSTISIEDHAARSLEGKLPSQGSPDALDHLMIAISRGEHKGPAEGKI